jgi:hypothetical protein
MNNKKRPFTITTLDPFNQQLLKLNFAVALAACRSALYNR